MCPFPRRHTWLKGNASLSYITSAPKFPVGLAQGLWQGHLRSTSPLSNLAFLTPYNCVPGSSIKSCTNISQRLFPGHSSYNIQLGHKTLLAHKCWTWTMLILFAIGTFSTFLSLSCGQDKTCLYYCRYGHRVVMAACYLDSHVLSPCIHCVQIQHRSTHTSVKDFKGTN